MRFIIVEYNTVPSICNKCIQQKSYKTLIWCKDPPEVCHHIWRTTSASHRVHFSVLPSIYFVKKSPWLQCGWGGGACSVTQESKIDKMIKQGWKEKNSNVSDFNVMHA